MADIERKTIELSEEQISKCIELFIQKTEEAKNAKLDSVKDKSQTDLDKINNSYNITSKYVSQFLNQAINEIFLPQSREEAYSIAKELKPEIAKIGKCDSSKVKSVLPLKDFVEIGCLRTIDLKVDRKLNSDEIIGEYMEDVEKAKSIQLELNKLIPNFILTPCEEILRLCVNLNKNKQQGKSVKYIDQMENYCGQPLYKALKMYKEQDCQNLFDLLLQPHCKQMWDKELCNMSKSAWSNKGIVQDLSSNYLNKIKGVKLEIKKLTKEELCTLDEYEQKMYNTLRKIQGAKEENVEKFIKNIQDEYDSLNDKLLCETNEKKKKNLQKKSNEIKTIIDFVSNDDTKQEIAFRIEDNKRLQIEQFLKNGGITKNDSAASLKSLQAKGKKLSVISKPEDIELVNKEYPKAFIDSTPHGILKDQFLLIERNGRRLFVQNSGLLQKLCGQYITNTDRLSLTEDDVLSESYGFKVKNGELFVSLQITFPEYEKKKTTLENWIIYPDKHAGSDINVSHGIIVANRNSANDYTEDENGILSPRYNGDEGLANGYINLYREMSNTGLLNVQDNDTKQAIDGLLNNIVFGVLEYKTIIENVYESCVRETRRCKAGDVEIEYEHFTRKGNRNKDFISIKNSMETVKFSLASSFDDSKTKENKGGDLNLKYQYDYVAHNCALLDDISNYMVHLLNLSNAQQSYDTAMGFDDSYDTKRKNDSFRSTELGGELYRLAYDKQRKAQSRCIQIARYAFNTLLRNGINHIALEDLDSSQMKSKYRFPTEDSILSFYGFQGLTEKECIEKEPGEYEENPYVKYVVNHKFYKPVFTDGKLSGLELTEEGFVTRRKQMMWTKSLHCIGFANIKNIATQMSSDRDMHVAFVNKAYTSQTDSKTGSLYANRVVDEKGNEKLVPTDKHNVRPNQHTCINGLNADVNAGGSILNGIVIHSDVYTDRKTFGKEEYRSPFSKASECSHYSLPYNLIKKEGGKYVKVLDTVVKQKKKNGGKSSGKQAKKQVSKAKSECNALAASKI